MITQPTAMQQVPPPDFIQYRDRMRFYSRLTVLGALKRHNYVLKATALELGFTVQTLTNKMKALNIYKPEAVEAAHRGNQP